MNQKILIIEDNNDIRENVVEILGLAGYTVFEADNGKTGIELAVNNLPDVILCDIMMPELDGYGVLFMLNKNPETAAIPFIFLTAKAERIDQRKGMEMGADDYLTKPFDDIELLNAIESRLRKKTAQQSFYSQSLENLNSIVSKNSGLTELKRIISERKVRLFKKDQVIYYDGDKGNGLYLILKGRVKTVKLANDGRELMTAIHSAEEYIGVNAMLSNEAYTDTATTLEDSQLCLIPKDQLDNLLNLYPDIAREFIKLLSNHIRDREEQLLQLAYNSVRKRMADTLVRLHKQQGGDFKISREDLAAMAGVATETVSRTLTDFKDENLIDKKGSQITVLSPERLAKMKN
ncbi:response regulator [Mucilaginibacter rubeus]|uniref:Response regulator n=1 Tax=Mucilaginibacter rubeus TaxID=2027860 RepID=A0AAE6JGQ4_9SPHI|nr:MULTISPECIES: response regulator [Mucilaginibacter]QEM05138.1 response regulator [Mucilaginibacter rubeus]QEM17730.1 response regulator [Mucilaginibacter gossypii]QTE45743.1 response regulator [Mucilaginibacter rubeus]QTE52340.1 response regulator [Mucilaginibacter rubeus]QTE57429.1 response regulator [Mucilaginibacter rubeus]